MIQNIVKTRNYYIHGSRIQNPLPVYELNTINNSLLKYAVLSLLEELTDSSEGFSSIIEANTLKIYRDEYEKPVFFGGLKVPTKLPVTFFIATCFSLGLH